jgi:sporulation protein YlmC with PRC-barrel domain
MSRTSLVWALALSSAIATPVLAQTDATKPAEPIVKQSDQAAPAPQAMPKAAAGTFITQAEKGQYRANKLVGVNIYNNSDENIGEVNEIMVDGNGRAVAVVVGVGGFLGIGEKNVALPFDAVKWTDEPRASAANTNPPPAATPQTPANSMAVNNPAVPDTTGAIPKVVHDYPDHGIVNMSKEQLTNAPEFKYLSERQ